MDTTQLIDLLWPDEDGNVDLVNDIKQVFNIHVGVQWMSKAAAADSVGENKDKFWKLFFRVTEMSTVFHGVSPNNNNNNNNNNAGPNYSTGHKHTFHHMVHTDGDSLSVLLVRKELAGSKGNKNPKVKYVVPFIDTIGAERRAELLEKHIIGIDPGIVKEIEAVSLDSNDYNNAVSNQQRRVVISSRKRLGVTRAQRLFDLTTKKTRKKKRKRKGYNTWF